MNLLEDQLGLDHFVDVDTSNGQNGKFTQLSWPLERMREARTSSHLELHMASFRGTAVPPSYFVFVVRGIAHVYDSETWSLPCFPSTRTGRFEVDLDELRHATDPRLRFYTGPMVTLSDLQWQDAIIIHWKRSRELE